MRLRFFWWGSFLRGWLQWGRAAKVCADKDCGVQTVWNYHFGPLEIQWWNRPDWHAFCFTKEEARAEDARDAPPQSGADTK